jgi:hypothetical protein
MPRGAPASKLAITVDRDVHAKVVRAAAEDQMSVSAWLTAAARHAIRLREGLVAVAEWEAEHGSFSEEELAEARQRIASAGAKKRRTGRRARRSP